MSAPVTSSTGRDDPIWAPMTAGNEPKSNSRKGRRSRGGGAAKPGVGKASSALERLRPDEHVHILKALLAKHPDLRPEAEVLAAELVSAASSSQVAEQVRTLIGLYDIEDLNRRTSDHSWGYIAPEEAADEILTEAIVDFLDEMKRKAELGFAEAALGVAVGIIGGLYDGREPATGSVLDWAHDFPLEAAARVVRDLRRSCPPGDRADVMARLTAAVEERAPEWGHALAREAARA